MHCCALVVAEDVVDEHAVRRRAWKVRANVRHLRPLLKPRSRGWRLGRHPRRSSCAAARGKRGLHVGAVDHLNAVQGWICQPLIVEILHRSTAHEAVLRYHVAPTTTDEAADGAIREEVLRHRPSRLLIVQVHRLHRRLLHTGPKRVVQNAAEVVTPEHVPAVGERGAELPARIERARVQRLERAHEKRVPLEQVLDAVLKVTTTDKAGVWYSTTYFRKVLRTPPQ